MRIKRKIEHTVKVPQSAPGDLLDATKPCDRQSSERFSVHSEGSLRILFELSSNSYEFWTSKMRSATSLWYVVE